MVYMYDFIYAPIFMQHAVSNVRSSSRLARVALAPYIYYSVLCKVCKLTYSCMHSSYGTYQHKRVQASLLFILANLV